MASSYDPRDAIMAQIGNLHYDPSSKREYRSFDIDHKGKTYSMKMIKSEECKTAELPELPFVKLHKAYTTYEPHDIAAATRRMSCFIDMKFYFTDTDNIDPASFKTTVQDKLHDLIRTNQESVTGTFFMNIESERDQEENDGTQVVFIYIATLFALYYDAC